MRYVLKVKLLIIQNCITIRCLCSIDIDATTLLVAARDEYLYVQVGRPCIVHLPNRHTTEQNL